MGDRSFVVMQDWTVKKALERALRAIESLKPGETLLLTNKSKDPSFESQLVTMIQSRFADHVDFVRTGSGRYRVVAKPDSDGCCGACGT
jgi:hypothetical protein